MFWHSPHGFGGDIGVIYEEGLMHCLVFLSPVEILGHSFVGSSIMNLKLFDAYHIINSRILAVTMEYRIDSLDICFGTQFADSKVTLG